MRTFLKTLSHAAIGGVATGLAMIPAVVLLLIIVIVMIGFKK